MGKLNKDNGVTTLSAENNKKDGVLMSYIKDNPIPTLAFGFTLLMAMIGAVSTYSVLKSSVEILQTDIKSMKLVSNKYIEIDKRMIILEQSNQVMQKTVNAQVDMLTHLAKENTKLRTDTIIMSNTVENLNSTLNKVNSTLDKLNTIVSKVDSDIDNLKEDVDELKG